MKKESYTKKSETELAAALTEKAEALRVFRFAGVAGRSKNIREGRTLRKEIARIKTEMTLRKAK